MEEARNRIDNICVQANCITDTLLCLIDAVQDDRGNQMSIVSNVLFLLHENLKGLEENCGELAKLLWKR